MTKTPGGYTQPQPQDSVHTRATRPKRAWRTRHPNINQPTPSTLTREEIERARNRHLKITRAYTDEDIMAGNFPSSTFTMRLQRYLARCGVASRRGAEKLISAGRVTVNGVVQDVLGSKVDCAHDVVCVDGTPCVLGDEHTYLILNKPQGVLTTMSDPFGHPCVAALVPKDTYPGLFAVGRLDGDTTGLLLFSTDGNMGNRLLHPSHHVWKTYVCLLQGSLTRAAQKQLEAGIMLDDGPCAPSHITRLAPSDALCTLAPQCHILDGIPSARGYTICSISIREGRYHQVKRMFDAVGCPVVRLHRAQFGPLSLGDALPFGAWRMCTPAEVDALMCTVSSSDGIANAQTNVQTKAHTSALRHTQHGATPNVHNDKDTQ